MIATATGPGGWAYGIALFFHLLTVIAGFGGIILNGLWGATIAKATGEPAALLARTLDKVSKIAEYFIYAVPVFGILVVVLSDDAHKFSSPWISASFALYIVGIGISHGLLMPNTRRLVALAEAGNEPTAERAAVEKKVAAISGSLHVILALILLLMVFGPSTSWLVSK